MKSIIEIKQPLDFVFIDADKENYKNYYNAVIEKLKPGGVIVFDNCLWGGSVLAPNPKDTEACAIAEVNKFVPLLVESDKEIRPTQPISMFDDAKLRMQRGISLELPLSIKGVKLRELLYSLGALSC